MCVCLHLCVPHICLVPVVLHPLELELEMVLSHHVGARNQPQIYERAARKRKVDLEFSLIALGC